MKLAVIADIHSNLPALEAVLEAIGKDGGADGYLCAGDLVGYYPFANETIERLGKLKNLCIVKGNHDHAAATGDLSFMSGDAEAAIEWTQKKLSEDNKKFISSLPLKYESTNNGRKISMFHGSPTGPLNEYVESDMPPDMMESMLFENQILILGHTHIPMIKTFYTHNEKKEKKRIPIAVQLAKMQTRYIFNAGSVGQPRDGNPNASFGIINFGSRITFKVLRTEYDIDTVAAATRKAGLPETLAKRLYLGK
ncbi:hypothetical protein AUJ13_01890 [Candidatus Micrarchaeota archaeon CG1_02_49_24]|nr:MAG: hypothetical protein AUJ13_01890 [Candidatus Micrarchaeota archaeon CG1_02_49_24]HII53514.1 metallophosphoesterase family protein [Candidatus Micrarchaeota archaeon]